MFFFENKIRIFSLRKTTTHTQVSLETVITNRDLTTASLVLVATGSEARGLVGLISHKYKTQTLNSQRETDRQPHIPAERERLKEWEREVWLGLEPRQFSSLCVSSVSSLLNVKQLKLDKQSIILTFIFLLAEGLRWQNKTHVDTFRLVAQHIP